MTKPNCYNCKYRSTIPGDCHSRCKHPSLKPIEDDPIAEILSIAGKQAGGLGVLVKNECNVKGNEHGIKNGWFNWPFNFDPTWLIKCDGFIEKD